MRPDQLATRTIVFVNIAHAFDHFVLLIYPTAVIAIAARQGLDYGALITLATGAFVAFGLCSLPMGWIADRVGRRTMLAVFFLGYGAVCLGLSTAGTPTAFAAWLLALGVVSAIYHPVGSSMLVANARRLGRDLGWNGVWGNLGAAGASAVTALLTATLGWRFAFVVPGVACMAAGFAYLWLVPAVDGPAAPAKRAVVPIRTTRLTAVLAVFALALVAGGMTFNVTTIALPKVIDEQVGIALPLVLTGSLATAIFLFGALTQLLVGRLLDRHPVSDVFVALALLQPIGLALAAVTTGLPMLVGLLVITSAIYGQVVVNDAMIARCVPDEHRAKAFGVRYFLGFTASGFAAPMIGMLHVRGGFPIVLGVAAGFGAVVLACAVALKLLVREQAAPAGAPAE